MILDALATFATTQSGTTSVASTDIIDTLAAGDAYNEAWFVFQVTTAFAYANGTAATARIQVQTSSDGFLGVGNDTTLVASAAFTASQLTAGATWKVKLPPNLKRYIRGYKLVESNDVSNNFSAGAWDMFLTADVNKIIGNPRYSL